MTTAPLTQADSTPVIGVAEASRRLGISEKRVRQLVDAGRLPKTTDEAGRLRIPEQAVNELRKDRRGQTGGAAAGEQRVATGSITPASRVSTRDEVTRIASEIIGVAMPRALEAATGAEQRHSETLRQQLDRERASREAAENRARDAEARLAVAEHSLDAMRRRVAQVRAKAGEYGETSAYRRALNLAADLLDG